MAVDSVIGIGCGSALAWIEERETGNRNDRERTYLMVQMEITQRLSVCFNIDDCLR